MTMEKPTVEFVALDLEENSMLLTASCGEEASQGGDRCIGDGPHTKCIGCEDVSADIAG